ncbi:MAG: hypothetical protein GQ534_07060 [Candidatus Delongbacteria bacterium]|nr:hypothetical protein [Candidatus Delongbacteria bacterium]
MKKFIVLLLVVILSVLFLGCGGDSSKGKTEKVKEQNSEEKILNQYTSKDGVITAKLPDGWNNKGKGPDNYSMYAYVSDNTGDIHKDIKTFDYQEQLDEVQEIKVDELPALTVKRKFMQREEMIGRTWLVYNGFDIIEVVVQSNTATWNDGIADQIISLIKINKRSENVTMPKPIEEKRYIRPESFPVSIEKFNDYYSNEAVFTVDKIKQSTNIYIALKDLQNKGLSEEAAKVVSDSIYAANGLEDLRAL